ncbi:MAG TPA: hypothetical protein VGB74_14295, partial [Actinoplanes sp.]
RPRRCRRVRKTNFNCVRYAIWGDRMHYREPRLRRLPPRSPRAERLCRDTGLTCRPANPISWSQTHRRSTNQ